MADIYDGKLTTVTLNAMRVQNALFLDIDHEYPENSTYNEHLGILAERLPEPRERSCLRYIGLGNAGHRPGNGPNGITIPKPVRHRATDSGAYNAIPWILRPVENDLSDDVRQNYALRRMETHANRRYWAYYLKRIDNRGIRTRDYKITVEEGKQTTLDFKYSEQDNRPTPPELPSHDYNVDDKVAMQDGEYVLSNADLDVRMDEFDAQEFQNVARVLYGDPDFAIISELFLLTGVDAMAEGDAVDGSPFQYEEAIGTQIAYHMTCFNNIAITNDRLTYKFKIGQSVPFFLGAPASR